MKKIIPLILTVTLMVLFASSVFALGAVFADVKETDWFAEAVSEAVALGLVNGKGNNRFDPDGNITLAEAVKLAACMNQLKAGGAVTLSNGNPWYETYASYGKEHFLVSSGSGFSYDVVMSNPNQIINRAEFAWLFAHAVTDLPEVNTIPDNAIPDVKDGTVLYYSEIYTLYRAGIINGSDKSGSFLPASNIKRSEVAAIVVRMMEPDKRVGPPANLGAAPELTLENIFAANYITVLLRRYGQVKIHMKNEFGVSDSWHFRHGEKTIVYLSEWQSISDPNSRGVSGQDGTLSFQIAEDGSVTSYIFPRFYHPNYSADDRNVDKNGEFYEGNTEIFRKLNFGTLDEIAETDAGYTFRVTVTEYTGTVKYYRCVADKRTLALTEVRDESGEYSIVMEYGENLTPFAAEYADAMKKTRTLTYHATWHGQTYDYNYTVPASWSFYLDASDMTFYKNADFTGVVENFVPADGKNYEFWCAEVMDSAKADAVSFTLDDLIEQNRITNLMKRHSCVTVRSADAKHSDEGTSYWIVGDDIVYADLWYSGNERNEMGAYGDFAYSVTASGQIRAKLWVSPSDYKNDDAVSSAFPNKLTEDIKILSSDNDTLTILLKGEVQAGEAVTAPIEMTAVVNKKTYELLSYTSTTTYSPGNVNYVENNLEYDNSPVGSSVMTGWDKTRAISIETAQYVWGTYPAKLTCPINWDLTITVSPMFGVKISVSGFEADEFGDFHVSAGEQAISVSVHS